MGTIKKINVNGIEYDLAGSGGAMINVTYSELVSLIGSSSLVQGNKYRITDYVTEFKSWKSAGHQFDIVVEAITEDRISDKASAMLHDGDIYFKNSRLSAWQIWYDINNDTSLFHEAKEGGKGSIYRMIDEFGNDVFYDFKNLLTPMTSEDNPNISSDTLDFYTFSVKDGSTVKDASLGLDKVSVFNNKITITKTLNKVPSIFKNSVISIDKPLIGGQIYNNVISGGLRVLCNNMGDVNSNIISTYCNVIKNNLSSFYKNTITMTSTSVNINGVIIGCSLIGNFSNVTVEGNISYSFITADGSLVKTINPFTLG